MTVTINRYRWANQDSLLLHCDGTDGSTTITDESLNTHAATVHGNAQIDTAQSKFGGASLLFDGAGDAVTFANDTSFEFGSGDFTVDLWARSASVDGIGTVFTQRDALNLDIPIHLIRNGTTYRFYASTSGVDYVIANAVSVGTAALNTWAHLAITRSGDDFKCFNNGALISSFTSSDTINNSSAPLQFGAQNITSFNFNGHLDEIRFTKGRARWTAAFTTPTVPGV